MSYTELQNGVMPNGASRANRLLGFSPTGRLALLDPINSHSAARFGIIGDGITDNTAAINHAEAELGPGDELEFGPGVYVFTAPLVTTRQRPCWRGAGPYQTTLRYDGASTNSDLLTIGDGTTEIINGRFSNFRIASNTTMTGGNAFRARRLCRSDIEDVIIDGQDGNGKLYDGFYFDETDHVSVRRWEARAANCGLKVRGAVGSGPKAGLFLLGGFKLSGCAVGILCGGAFGGLYVDEGDISVNGIHFKLDESLAAEANREVFFGPLVSLDFATSGPAVYINQLISAQLYIQFDGTWIASGPTHAVHVKSLIAGKLNITGGTVFNFVTGTSHGVYVEDTSAVVSVNSTRFRSLSGYGVHASSANSNLFASGIFEACTLGGLSANVQGRQASTGTVNTNAVTAPYFGVDETYYATLSGANPLLNWGSNTYDLYDRTNLLRQTWVNGANKFEVGAAMNTSFNPIRLPGYLFASLPSASALQRCMVTVLDRNYRLAVSDGTTWRWAGDGTVAS